MYYTKCSHLFSTNYMNSNKTEISKITTQKIIDTKKGNSCSIKRF